MRSRYSAFVMDLLDYLLDTWHPDTRPKTLDPNPPGIKWLGLRITSRTTIDDTHATVEFVARSRHEGRATRLVEKSRFVKESGRWLYLDGEIG
jgi:SEC-C motif-containing protein